MNDVLLYTILAASIFVVLFIIGIVRSKSSGVRSASANAERQPGVEPVPPVRRVGGRIVRSRLHHDRRLRDDEEAENRVPVQEEQQSDEEETTSFYTKKIGVKKRKKLEMKAERRIVREQELQIREEQKRTREELEERRKQEEEAARKEEAKQAEIERLIKEEKKKQEHEEYLKLKASFEVECEGFTEETDSVDEQDLLQSFMKYIQDEKVVLLEDLAARFKLKTQDVIKRINSLMESDELTGVIDDRGKFIYISWEEMNAVAKFIRQRGRISISELAECSNTLINMASKERVTA